MINNEDAVVISDNAKYLFHNDQAIILNRTNRQWIKISKECYEVLMQCNGKYTIKELLHMLIDNEDREYVKKVLDALDEMELIGKSPMRKLHDVSFAISNRCNQKCKHCM